MNIQHGMSTTGAVTLLIAMAFVFLVYFLPSIIAFQRKKANSGAIVVLNLLLGWTMVGWIVSLIWAL